MEKAVEQALEAGYRHIDTATVYENEKIIGKVLNKWIDSGKVKRSDLFIVTKVRTCQLGAVIRMAAIVLHDSLTLFLCFRLR